MTDPAFQRAGLAALAATLAAFVSSSSARSLELRGPLTFGVARLAPMVNSASIIWIGHRLLQPAGEAP